MTPHVEKKRDASGTITLLIFIIVVVGFVGWIFKDSPSKQNEQQTTDTPVQKLGPEWEKIEMVPDQWYGPYSIRGGSGWTVVGEGKIVAQIDDRPPFKDSSTTAQKKRSGKSVKFKVADGYTKATIYFKY